MRSAKCKKLRKLAKIVAKLQNWPDRKLIVKRKTKIVDKKTGKEVKLNICFINDPNSYRGQYRKEKKLVSRTH